MPELASVIGPRLTSARMMFSIVVFARAKEFGGHGRSASSAGADFISGRLVPAKAKRELKRLHSSRVSRRKQSQYQALLNAQLRSRRRKEAVSWVAIQSASASLPWRLRGEASWIPGCPLPLSFKHQFVG